MQEMYAAFNAWQEKFKANIVDMGGKLKPGGRILNTSGVTDGPFTEAKEIVGGYMALGLRIDADGLHHRLATAGHAAIVAVAGHLARPGNRRSLATQQHRLDDDLSDEVLGEVPPSRRRHEVVMGRSFWRDATGPTARSRS